MTNDKQSSIAFSDLTQLDAQGVAVLGQLPEDPDLLEVTPPSGLFWATGSGWSGKHDLYEIIDLRVMKHGEAVDMTITAQDAGNIMTLLQSAIEQAYESTGKTADAPLSADLQSKSPAGQRAPSDEGTLA